MVLNNLFMRLCKYCSEEAGSIEWCQKMSFSTIFVCCLIIFMSLIGVHESRAIGETFPLMNIICVTVSVLGVVITSIYTIWIEFFVKDEEKHYVLIKLFSIVINFTLGFEFYVIARLVTTSLSIFYKPTNIVKEAFLMVSLMGLCMILMLVGLKKNMLSDSLAMLYHTRKSGKKVDNYAPYYVAVLVGMSFGAGTLRFGFDLDRIFYAFIGGVLMLFSAYIMISCMLSLIYFFVQIKYPELRRDE